VLEDRLDVVGEAHVEHLVGLVEHHGVMASSFSDRRLMRSIARPGVATTTWRPARAT
jgi:hypothetical protein